MKEELRAKNSFLKILRFLLTFINFYVTFFAERKDKRYP
jgi:hypothetical protein